MSYSWKMWRACLGLLLLLSACGARSATEPGALATGAPTVNTQPAGSAQTTPTGPTADVVFATLEPGSALPDGSQCADQVKPTLEMVIENEPYNATRGTAVVGKTYLSSDISATDFEERVDGDFVGTTDEIIQWGACKWGFDENIVRAQAYAESTWFAGKLGDCGEAARPETGGEGGCSSVGLMQIRSAEAVDPVFQGVWPMSWESTAFNVDYALAVHRACFEGREVWLNNQSGQGEEYEAGDEWGCIGRWFSGSWRNLEAEEYISRVRSHLEVEPWGEYAGCPNWQDSFYCSDIDREIPAG